MWLSGIAGHGASGLVSQRGRTIKSPWYRTITSRYPSSYDLRWLLGSKTPTNKASSNYLSETILATVRLKLCILGDNQLTCIGTGIDHSISAYFTMSPSGYDSQAIPRAHYVTLCMLNACKYIFSWRGKIYIIHIGGTLAIGLENEVVLSKEYEKRRPYFRHCTYHYGDCFRLL